MPTRPRSNESNENNNSAQKKGRFIELHGHNCQEINDLLKGIDEDEKEDIANKFRYRETALQLAVEDNNADVVRCLLTVGADPNKRINVKIYTPLHLAIYNNNLEIVELLLAGSADSMLGVLIDGRVYSPFYTACEKGNMSIINKLIEDDEILESINDPIQDDPYITPLVIAILEGHKDLVTLLKKNGAELTPKKPFTKDDIQDMLSSAAHGKKFKRVKMLLDDFDYIKEQLNLDFDFDVNYYSDDNYSTLYNAVTAPDNLEIVEYLIGKGAALDPKAYKSKSNVKAKTEFQRLMENGIYTEYRRFLEPIETPVRRSVYNNNTRRRKAGKRKTRKH
jgi:ankyrin repeat protein